MRFKLYITCSVFLFCFFITLQWGHAQPYVPKENLTQFQWLVRFLNNSDIRANVFGADAKKKAEEIAGLNEGLSAQEQGKITKFLNVVSQQNKQPLFDSFDNEIEAICKQRPCPPVLFGAETRWYWVIATIRDSSLRQKLFNPTTASGEVAKFRTTAENPAQLVALTKKPTFQTSVTDISKILCDPNVWGPCP